MKDLEILKVLALNIKIHRESKGFSQEELGEICGLHRNYIGRLEKAKNNITLNTLARIAKGLNLSPKELLEGENVSHNYQNL